MSYQRRQYKGNVSSSDKLASGIGTGDTSFALQDGTTFPDGTVGPFVITIDQGNATEEKCLVTTRTGTTLNTVTRGYDGTSAAAHASGASVLHTISAVDMDEANQVVHNTLGTITTAGDILFAANATSMSRLGIGAANRILTSSGTAPQWTAIDSTAADITNSAVGDVAAAGAVGKVADAGHTHGRESFGTTATTSAVGDSQAPGTATTPSRSDHKHGREAFAVGASTTSNPGDSAADGTSTSPARADHKHGRESGVNANCRAYRNAALTTTAGANTLLPFDTVSFDSASGFNTTTHLYTVPTTGVYLVRGVIYVTSSTTGDYYYTLVVKNGTPTTQGNAIQASGGAISSEVTDLVSCTAGDTLGIDYFTTTAVGVHAGSDGCSISIVKVSG